MTNQSKSVLSVLIGFGGELELLLEILHVPKVQLTVCSRPKVSAGMPEVIDDAQLQATGLSEVKVIGEASRTDSQMEKGDPTTLGNTQEKSKESSRSRRSSELQEKIPSKLQESKKAPRRKRKSSTEAQIAQRYRKPGSALAAYVGLPEELDTYST